VTAPAVTAIVVNFEAGDLLTGCVQSLEAAGVDEIIVVDNASADGSVEHLCAAGTTAEIITAPANRGYGAGINLGARHASSPVLLACNADLVVAADVLEPLLTDLRANPDVSAVGPRILTNEGDVYPSARSFPSLAESAGHAFVGLFSQRNKWTRSYKHLDQDLRPEAAAGGMTEVDWVSGACVAIRREAFNAVGGFDERYFMYLEDVDLCWRLRRAGWRIVYEPGAVVTHVQGVSTRRRPYRMIVAHHRSAWRFARRTAQGRGRFALPAVAVGLTLRLGLACAKQALAAGLARRRARPSDLP
jgi:N-acetylglucosaminyl-diphospho-decaprenol L-rhamnosyltransferase